MVGKPLFQSVPTTEKWLPLIENIMNQLPVSECVAELNDLRQLCDDAKEVLHREQTCLELNIQPSERLIIVGDVHGQLRDLLQHVLSIQTRSHAAGEPDNTFLFLGDFVDRGPCGVEVLTLLLALKVTYPKRVHLLRGNHEDVQTCRIYGFLAECRAKLDVASWTHFTGVFPEMPLAAAVGVGERYIFCCHGGLSPQLRQINAINLLQRAEYGVEMTNTDESDVIDGLLWSDPAEHDEPFRSNLRGCGYTFGAAACDTFLAANPGVLFICRAHQMVMDGFQWSHGGKLLTVFSAPNYCGINNNKGAVAIIRGDGQPADCSKIAIEFVDFMSAEASASAPAPGSIGDYFGM